ncbi:SpoIIE family protein phosphatase [Nostocoides australiense]
MSDGVQSVEGTFEQLPLILGGFGPAPEYRFDAANAAYREFLGRDDVIGRSAPDLFPEWIGQQVFEAFDRVVASGQSETVSAWGVQAEEPPAEEPDEIYVDMVVTPRRDDSGTVNGVTVHAMPVVDGAGARRAEHRRTLRAERRYEAARDVVAELQSALLPTVLPVLPEAVVAARYLVAADDQAAGGDWFDAIPLADGRLGLVVGDLVGHGVTASAAMGQLRTIVATVLTETGSLDQALLRADLTATQSSAMRAATICAAVLDPATGSLDYATCGHLPPLIVRPDGHARFLPPSRSGPLGTGSTPTTLHDVLDVGDVAFFYTDGLVERPGQDLRAGMDALVSVVRNAVVDQSVPVEASATAAERACVQGVEVLTRSGYDDDVTALAVERRANVLTPLTRQLEADMVSVAHARATMREWLRPLDLTDDDAGAVDLIVTELVANAVEHASTPGAGQVVDLAAQVERDGMLRVTVCDQGTWREPTVPYDTSGRGLWLVGSLVQELDIDHTAGSGRGTVITAGRALTRQAILGDQPESVPSVRVGREYAADLMDGPPRTLVVHGPLDITTAEQFARDLDIHSRGGVFPLVLDLGDADVLASSAVQAIFAARTRHAAHGNVLTIRSAPDAPANQVLRTVGLAGD